MTEDQTAVFDFLRVDEPAFIDSILGGVAMPPARIMQTLLELEMNGLIRQLPGKNFLRKL